jgi:two-component system CheB/CheR fusion protein
MARKNKQRAKARKKRAPEPQPAPAGAAPRPGFPIVALGASAGGLEAFRSFFAHMPGDSGMAFVLIPHLDPHHPSAMRDLISNYTSMPVAEAAEGVSIQPNRVYVIPPNVTLGIEGGRLSLAAPSQPRGQRTPIDHFFNSLAADQGSNAICIILSGTGSDGTLGLAAVKEQGGLTMAQFGGSLRFDSMPRHARATGLVDFALPVEEMPQRLLEHMRHRRKIDGSKGMDGLREEVAGERLRICLLLRNRTGHDFSNYKENTFVRRVLRRMQVLQLESAAALIERLRREPPQIDLLLQELLIGVTQFFRDPKAFEALEKRVIPEILGGHSGHQPVRVWVPGCSSGEEVYSLAMLFREQIARREDNIRVQIFATDIDAHALDVARQAFYPDSIVGDVSPERLERFFTRDSGGYRIVKELRETCILSVHNLVKDPPFSKLDLVSCRNLLIYLNADLQKRVVPLLHFALNSGGFLFLGPSENVNDNGKLFSRVDPKNRIFKRRAATVGHLPEFPLTAPGTAPNIAPRRPERRAEDEIGRRAEALIEGRRPAYVVIDEGGEIVRFSGPTSRYLEHANGTASLNLHTLLRKSLRSEVRALLNEAVAGRKRVEPEPIPVDVNGGVQDVFVVIEPLPDQGAAEPLWVVSFQGVGPVRKAVPPGERTKTRRESQRRKHLDSLEQELLSTRERLQSTIEELETSNEELKSSNEEFQSLNEELQSANEELETSKEELHSVNEELETVNSELNSKVESLDRANSDLKNLLESTQIATVFLGNDLGVKSFTPAITEVFNLIEGDIGRPITDISGRLKYDDLESDVRKVLRTLGRVEREVRLRDGETTYIMRILPYRTMGNVIDGVVITFVDVTERKAAEEERALLAAIVKSSPDAIIVSDPGGAVVAWNLGAERMFGYLAGEMVGRPVAETLGLQHADVWRQQVRRAQRGDTLPPVDLVRVRKDGSGVHVSASVAAVRDAAGKVVAISSIERDVSEARRNEERQRLLLAELDHRVKNTLAIVTSIVSRTVAADPAARPFAEAIQGRLKALGQAHRVLSHGHWQGSPLAQVLREQLVPFRGRRLRNVRLEGPEVMLAPRAALTLSMAIYELASNAAKYGALSVAEGRLTIEWRMAAAENGSKLVLEWREKDGPAVGRPEGRGFGSDLIERAIPYELGGTARLRYASKGVQCTIEFPLQTGADEPRAEASG